MAGQAGETKMRNRNWKKETTYEQRKADWQSHDQIIDCLCRFQDVRKATQEEDYNGVDFWYQDMPFDIKTTFGYPRSCPYSDSYNIFLWMLQHQDLDRFHNTNRIIIILNQQKIDPLQIACQFNDIMNNRKYWNNITYRLKGRDGQENHPLHNKILKMKIGIMIDH